jgi:hypothetical protein
LGNLPREPLDEEKEQLEGSTFFSAVPVSPTLNSFESGIVKNIFGREN